MPPLSVHLHLAVLFWQQHPANLMDRLIFALGSVAPDACDLSDSQAFQRHHMVTPHGRPDDWQRQELCAAHQHAVGAEAVFLSAYRLHLWLDDWVHTHDTALPMAVAGNLSLDEQRARRRAALAYLDAQAVQPYREELHRELLAGRAVFQPVMELGFLDHAQVAAVLQHTLDLLRDAALRTPPEPLPVSTTRYEGFLQEALKEWMQIDC